LERVGEVYSLSGIPKQQQTSNTDLLLNTRDLQEMMDLSDSLFSTLKQPFDFPNPRELCKWKLVYSSSLSLYEAMRSVVYHGENADCHDQFCNKGIYCENANDFIPLKQQGKGLVIDL
jgi:hypothetical protein